MGVKADVDANRLPVVPGKLQMEASSYPGTTGKLVVLRSLKFRQYYGDKQLACFCKLHHCMCLCAWPSRVSSCGLHAA